MLGLKPGDQRRSGVIPSPQARSPWCARRRGPQPAGCAAQRPTRAAATPTVGPVSTALIHCVTAAQLPTLVNPSSRRRVEGGRAAEGRIHDAPRRCGSWHACATVCHGMHVPPQGFTCARSCVCRSLPAGMEAPSITASTTQSLRTAASSLAHTARSGRVRNSVLGLSGATARVGGRTEAPHALRNSVVASVALVPGECAKPPFPTMSSRSTLHHSPHCTGAGRATVRVPPQRRRAVRVAAQASTGKVRTRSGFRLCERRAWMWLRQAKGVSRGYRVIDVFGLGDDRCGWWARAPDHLTCSRCEQPGCWRRRR
jgi:hypothetical protein